MVVLSRVPALVAALAPAFVSLPIHADLGTQLKLKDQRAPCGIESIPNHPRTCGMEDNECFHHAIANIAFGTTLLQTAALPTQAVVSVDIVVEDVRSEEGRILVEVLASAEAFAGDAPAIQRLELEAQSPATCFTLRLPPGTYALRILHDLDGDYAMTTNLVGMPAEPWAFSNNATGRFGPPGWEAARFEVGSEPVSQTLQLVQ